VTEEGSENHLSDVIRINRKSILTVETLEVEASLGLTLPQTKVVGVFGSITWDHDIVGQGQNLLPSAPDATSCGGPLGLAVEPDFVLDIVTWDLEWVEMLQPGIGGLELATVGGNQLLEDTVLVPEGVSPDRQLLRGRRVQVTCSQTAETTVSKSRITLFINEIFEVETELFDTVLVLIFQAEVEEGVVEGTTHQVLDTKVIRAFRLLASVGELSLVPVQLYGVSGRSSRCKSTGRTNMLSLADNAVA